MVGCQLEVNYYTALSYSHCVGWRKHCNHFITSGRQLKRLKEQNIIRHTHFNKAANVGDVGWGLSNRLIFFHLWTGETHWWPHTGWTHQWHLFLFRSTPYLSCKAAAQVHGTGAALGCLEPQHDGGGEFIVSSATTGLLLLATQTHQAMRQH